MTVAIDIASSLAQALVRWVPLVQGEVHAVTLPQPPVYPAVAYAMSGGTRIRSMTGQSGLCRADVDLDCWARTYAEAKAIARQVRLGICSHLPQTAIADGGPIVGGIHLSGDRDDYDSAGQAFVVTIPCVVWYEEAVFG